MLKALPNTGVPFYECRVWAIGKKPRERKVKKHTITVGYVPFDTEPKPEDYKEEIQAAVNAFFKGKEFKLDAVLYDYMKLMPDGIQYWEPCNVNNRRYRV